MNSEQDKTMELLTATTPLDMEIQHMEPLDRVNGFDVRPGFYMFDGATPIPRGQLPASCSSITGRSPSLMR